MVYYVFFFFQAEDGIRDVAVTGVQTCALPILPLGILAGSYRAFDAALAPIALFGRNIPIAALIPLTILWFGIEETRSEERRVGKSVDLGGRRIIKKKKKRE